MPNLFDSGYASHAELMAVGFAAIGENVKIAKSCTIIGPKNIRIGDNVRIDGYCSVIAAADGFLRLGSHIHIGGYCGLYAGYGIILENFSGLSQGVRVYSGSDDYSGRFMTNPTVPERYTGVVRGEVRFCRHAIVGTGSVILPDLTIGEGTAVGAMSLVNKSLAPWGMYVGCPVRRIKDRSRELLKLEAEFLSTQT